MRHSELKLISPQSKIKKIKGSPKRDGEVEEMGLTEKKLENGSSKVDNMAISPRPSKIIFMYPNQLTVAKKEKEYGKLTASEL